MLEKLNNQHYWLTEEVAPEIIKQNDATLKDMMFAESGDKSYSYIYYHEGSTIIDNMVGINYTDNGYISTVISTVPTIGIVFINAHNKNVHDSGIFHINRDSIISFDEVPNVNKEIIDLSKCKDYFRYARNMTGLLGRTITNAIDKKKAFPMIVKNGIIFNLHFLGKDNQPQTIKLFTEEMYASHLRIFLNTYYKKVLPEEAKKPVSDSLCYIATACYGDLYAKEVILLRKFRDEYLKNYKLGRIFISLYYFSSNYLYTPLLNSPKLSSKIKIQLDKLTKIIEKKYF